MIQIQTPKVLACLLLLCLPRSRFSFLGHCHTVHRVAPLLETFSCTSVIPRSYSRRAREQLGGSLSILREHSAAADTHSVRWTSEPIIGPWAKNMTFSAFLPPLLQVPAGTANHTQRLSTSHGGRGTEAITIPPPFTGISLRPVGLEPFPSSRSGTRRYARATPPPSISGGFFFAQTLAQQQISP